MEIYKESSGLGFLVKKVVYKGKSKFQAIEILDLDFFGRSLFLNKEIQLSYFDEFEYHNFFASIGCKRIKKDSSVLILGGGDGGLAREVLKYKNVSSILVVDIDKKVVNVSKKYLQKVEKKSFSNKKVKLIIEDAYEFVKNCEDAFDIIFIDLIDPPYINDPLPGHDLVDKFFKKKFAVMLDSIINAGGKVCVQSGGNMYKEFSAREHFKKEFLKVFKNAKEYKTPIPSFGGLWYFLEFSK